MGFSLGDTSLMHGHVTHLTDIMYGHHELIVISDKIRECLPGRKRIEVITFTYRLVFQLIDSSHHPLQRLAAVPSATVMVCMLHLFCSIAEIIQISQCRYLL
jgi:hypothetical protein